MSITSYFKIKEKQKVVVFTDGACINNGQKNARGGIGVFFPDCEEQNISIPLLDNPPTNNKAELTAIKLALQHFDSNKHIILYTDSQYAINCITKWAPGWESKNWKRKGKEVANKELIKEILDLSRARTVEFRHVNSHQTAPIDPELYKIWYGNMRADKLATEGIHLPLSKK